MFLSFREIIDILIMVFAIGYIFSTYFRRQPGEGYDPLKYYNAPPLIEQIKYGAMIAAPAVVLHELAHKFVAMGFGAQATLHAPLSWYVIVIIMRLLNFPLMFFVGGYVAHTALPPLESAIVSAAGPLTNLLLYLAALGIVHFRLVKRKHYPIIGIAGKLNLFLFGFNLIPLPGFDGYNLFTNLYRVFF